MTTSHDKPYPRYCGECKSESVQPTDIVYDAVVKHDGKPHSFRIDRLPIDKCTRCGEQYFTLQTDDSISSGLRTHLCLLQPEEILDQLSVLEIDQHEFATRIGTAHETLSRWLSGHTVQNRAMDNLMRVFFGLSQVREALTLNGPLSNDRQSLC